MILLALLLHEESVSSSRVEISGREARVTFSFPLEELAGLARLDLNRDGIVEPDEWTRLLPSLVPYLTEKFRIENNGDACRGDHDPRELPPALALADARTPVTLTFRYRSAQPMDRVTLHCELFREHGGNPRHIAELPGGRTVVFDRDRAQAEVVLAPARAGLSLPLGALALGIVGLALRFRFARGPAA